MRDSLEDNRLHMRDFSKDEGSGGLPSIFQGGKPNLVLDLKDSDVEAEDEPGVQGDLSISDQEAPDEEEVRRNLDEVRKRRLEGKERTTVVEGYAGDNYEVTSPKREKEEAQPNVAHDEEERTAIDLKK